MTKFLITLSFAMACMIAIAQPSAFRYQAVVRDAGGDIIANQAVAFRIKILKSVGVPLVYTEDHSTMTNEFGLVNLEIGNGTPVSGNFGTIDWGLTDYFIEISLDPTGGTNYTLMGTSQLLSVPYSKYADRSGQANPIGTAGGNLTGSYPNPTIANGSVTGAKLNSMGASTGNLLGYDGTTWNPVTKSSVSPWNRKANGDIEYPNGRAFIGASWGSLPSNFNLAVIDTTPTFIVVGGTTFNTGVAGGIAFTEGFNSLGSCGFDFIIDGNAFGTSGLVLVAGCPTKNDTVFEVARDGRMFFRDQVIIDAHSLGSATYTNNGADFYINHRNITGTTATDHRRKGIMLKNKSATTTRWNIYTASSGYLQLYYDGTLRGQFNNSTGVYSTSSDHRLKKEVQPIKPALESILKMPVVSYRYIFQEDDDNRRNIGLMAQDMQQHFPELVYTTTDMPSELGIAGETLMLDYAGLSVVAIKAIQEQQAIIDEQNEKIASLEQKMNELLSK